jgi:hypothetical protein
MIKGSRQCREAIMSPGFTFLMFLDVEASKEIVSGSVD